MLKHWTGSAIWLPNLAPLRWAIGLAEDPEQPPCRLF